MLEVGSGMFDGSDVSSLLAKIPLLGGARDANASDWYKDCPTRPHDLDGAWASRWSGGSAGESWIIGTAQVHVIGDYFYALTHDGYGDCLIGARFLDTDRLAGRYVNLTVPTELLAWVGRIVSTDRVDGFWLHGRWDLRRSGKA